MNKVRFIAFALVMVFAANFSVMALSLEAQALIEEMRERLLQRETISAPLTRTAAPDDYVPGRELKMALARVRIALHPDQYAYTVQEPEQPKITPSASIDIATADTYRPGSLLKPAMERVRAVRAQYWPAVQMEFTNEPPHEKQPTASKATVPVSDDSQMSDDSQKMRTSISRTPEFIEVDTAKRLEQRRRQLLRAKGLPDLSSPAETAKTQSVMEPDSLDPEQESKKFNRYISRYEYKMPSNYRIIVR